MPHLPLYIARVEWQGKIAAMHNYTHTSRIAITSASSIVARAHYQYVVKDV